MSDLNAPAPAGPRRNARRGGTASQPASRDPSPSSAAAAPAPDAAGSALMPNKDALAQADATTSAKAADVVVAIDGGNKEQQEKPPSGVANDAEGEDGKDASAGLAPADEVVAVFKQAIEDGKEAGGMFTPYGMNIAKALEIKGITARKLSLEASGVGGTSRLAKLLSEAAKASVNRTAVLGYTPNLVTEASDLGLFTQSNFGALVQSEVSIGIPPNGMGGNVTVNATITGTVFSAQIQDDEVVLLVDVPAGQHGNELAKQPKSDKKLLGLSFFSNSKDGKMVRMCFRAKLGSYYMSLVHVNVSKLSPAATAALLSPNGGTLKKFGLCEEYNGGHAVEVGDNACQGIAAYSALLGAMFEFERPLKPAELGAGAALLFKWQKNFVLGDAYFSEIALLGFGDDRDGVLQGIEGFDEAAKIKALVTGLREAAVLGTALPWADSPARLSFVERCAALMSDVGGQMVADPGGVDRLQAHHAALVSSLADNCTRDEGALRSLSLLLHPFVNIGYAMIDKARVTVTFPYGVNPRRPSIAVFTRPGHWFHAWRLEEESPLYVATTEQIADADARSFLRKFVAERATVERHRMSGNAIAAEPIASSSAPKSRKSTKKCQADGCNNTAPPKDNKCGKCKAASSIAPDKTAPTKAASVSTASAWYKPPAVPVKLPVASAAPKSAEARLADKSADNETNPWTAVGFPRIARGVKQAPKPMALLHAAQDFVRSALQGAPDAQISAALKHVAVAAGNGASMELAVFGGLCSGFCASGSACCVGMHRSHCRFWLHGKQREREHFGDATEAATFAARNREHVSREVLWLADRVLATGGKAIVWSDARAAMQQQRKANDAYFPHVEAARQVVADRHDLRSLARSHELAGEARVRVKTKPSATASRAGQNLSTSGGTGVHASSGTPRAAPSQGAAPRAAVTPAVSCSTGDDSHSNFEHGSSPLSGTSFASTKSVSAAASPAASGVSSDSAAIVALAAQLQAQGAALEKMVATMDSFQRFMTSFSSRASSPAVDASCAAPPASPSSAGGGVVGGSPPLVSPDAGGGEGGAEQSHQ